MTTVVLPSGTAIESFACMVTRNVPFLYPILNRVCVVHRHQYNTSLQLPLGKQSAARKGNGEGKSGKNLAFMENRMGWGFFLVILGRIDRSPTRDTHCLSVFLPGPHSHTALGVAFGFVPLHPPASWLVAATLP